MDPWIAIPIILIAIVIHEAWGHKLVAEKFFGLKPKFIAIGIPIKIGKFNSVFYTWNRPGKLPIVFSYLMIGGGVGFDDKEYYTVGKYWQKVVMILAGPAVNFIISFLLISIFTNPVLGLHIIWSYSGVTLEVIKSIFTKMTIDQALGTHQFFELTLLLAQTTKYWSLLAYFALWNVSIGVINLFPVPGMDGGQIVGMTIINLVGEKAIGPVKKINSIFSYALAIITSGMLLWWIGATLLSLSNHLSV